MQHQLDPRHRGRSTSHGVVILLAVVAIATAIVVLESPGRALGSPVVAVALAGIATVVRLDHQNRRS
jgi:hypothetical protein